MQTASYKARALLTSVMLCISATPAFTGKAHALRYGAICNGTFENDPKTGKPYLAPYDDPDGTCTGFLSHMGSSPSWRFNWSTLFGEVHAFQQMWSDWESNFVEQADIVFYTGHGNSSLNVWETYGYALGDYISSGDMCLGEANSAQRGVSVLSLNSCYSLTPSPTTPANTDKTGVEPPIPATATNPQINFPAYKFEFYVGSTVDQRWRSVMQCGLRMITGAWHEMPIANSKRLATNYATYLSQGMGFADAWSKASFDQSPTAAVPNTYTSGTSVADCFDNLRNLKLSNLTAKSRVTSNMTTCFVPGF